MMNEMKKYGAKELKSGDPRIAELTALGWKCYKEHFNSDQLEMSPIGDNNESSWTLSGSKYSLLVVVYDPTKWELRAA